MRVYLLITVVLALTLFWATAAKKKGPRRSEESLNRLRQNIAKINEKVKRRLARKGAARIPDQMVGVKVPKQTETAPGLHQPSIAEMNVEVADIMHEGDELLTDEQAEALAADNGDRRKRKVDTGVAKWPNPQQIPYRFDTTQPPSAATKAMIRQSMDLFEEHTCLRFIEDNTAQYPMVFFNDTGCWSYVGYTSSIITQMISIQEPGCDLVSTIQHEIGHALGLRHEHTRSDRDAYVTITTANIEPDMLHNFDLATTDDRLAYEYGSAMHYSADAFSINASLYWTMYSNDPLYQVTMGSRGEDFTEVDYMTLNLEYCTAAKGTPNCEGVTNPCQNGGEMNPNDCSTCICPDSFGGQYCDQLAASENQACGGILPADSNWQTKLETVGTTDTTDAAHKCYWHITSPPCTNIEARFSQYHYGSCNLGCYWGYIEFKPNNFFWKGPIFCCANVPAMNQTMQGGTLFPVIIRGHFQFTMGFDYRYVGTPCEATTLEPTTTTPVPTTTTPEPTTTTPEPTTTTPEPTTTTPEPTSTTPEPTITTPEPTTTTTEPTTTTPEPTTTTPEPTTTTPEPTTTTPEPTTTTPEPTTTTPEPTTTTPDPTTTTKPTTTTRKPTTRRPRVRFCGHQSACGRPRRQFIRRARNELVRFVPNQRNPNICTAVCDAKRIRSKHSISFRAYLNMRVWRQKRGRLMCALDHDPLRIQVYCGRDRRWHLRGGCTRDDIFYRRNDAVQLFSCWQKRYTRRSKACPAKTRRCPF